MKYAILADIHSNLEALEAVLEDAKKHGAKKFIVLGDIVGYGPNPSECIELLRENECIFVKGNHDAKIATNQPAETFNQTASKSVVWTREQVSEEQRDFLNELPIVAESGLFSATHGSFFNPSDWLYIRNIEDAKKAFDYLTKPVGFIGHTHLPKLFVKRGEIFEDQNFSKFKIKRGSKYIVNPGSVGQPRDGNPQASYCILNTFWKTVELKRVSYDISKTQRKIIEATLPEQNAARLEFGQ